MRRSHGEGKAPSPAYCTPEAYDVWLDKNVLLVHRGLNRRQRRELEWKLSHFNNPGRDRRPTSLPFRLSKRSQMRDVLKRSPHNYPIRKLFGKYLFEPEYWEVLPKIKQMMAERDAASIPQDTSVDPATEPSTTTPNPVAAPQQTTEVLPHAV